MADRMIVLDIKEIQQSRVVGVDSVTTDIITATIPPKLAAATLRALADELDPPRPLMRGVSE